MDIKIKDLYDLDKTIAKEYLMKFEYPFEALEGIKDLIIDLSKDLDMNEYIKLSSDVYAHKTAKIYPSTCILGPTIIGANTEIRHSAFIRGNAIVGKNCVIGNSVELKNVIIFDNCEVPHFNYVGDSILGYKAHMGAGAITSNVKSDRLNVIIHADIDIKTNRKKVGAFLGDYVEVGCNSVLNPGTIVGKNTNIYPLSGVRGVIPSNSIFKNGVICKKN